MKQHSDYSNAMNPFSSKGKKRGKNKNQGEKHEVGLIHTIYFLSVCNQTDYLCRILGEEARGGISLFVYNTKTKSKVEITSHDQICKAGSKSKADLIVIMKSNGEEIRDSIKSYFNDCEPPTILNHTFRYAKVFQEGGVLHSCLNTLDRLEKFYKRKRQQGEFGEDIPLVVLINKYCSEHPDVDKRKIIEDMRKVCRYFTFKGSGSGDSDCDANRILIIKNEPAEMCDIFHYNGEPIKSIPIPQTEVIKEDKFDEYFDKIFNEGKLIVSWRTKDDPSKDNLEKAKNWGYLNEKGKLRNAQVHIRMKKPISKPKPQSPFTIDTIKKLCKSLGIKGYSKVRGHNKHEYCRLICEQLGCEPNDSYDQMCKSICEALGVDNCSVLNKMKEYGKIKELVDKRLLEIESSKST